MTFTDRSMLVALVALAIPLAIYLLGRRRARRVLLPTARFAEGAHQASRSHLWLKRAALLSSRLAVVALLVLALAGPHLSCGVATAPEPATVVAGYPQRTLMPKVLPGQPDASASGSERATLAARLLVVDAADEAGQRLRSADLVAMALAPGGDAPQAKKVARTDAAKLVASMLEATDVVFWVGPHAPASGEAIANFISRGGAVVWVPADLRPPEEALAKVLGVAVDAAEAVPAGATIDAAGYTSDLLAAFEGGTSGDLAAPIFTQRLRPVGPAAIRFRDGSPAAVDRLSGKGRVVVLAVGPAPAWGNLYARPEFVVLMHSIAEALAPHASKSRASSVSSGASSSSAGAPAPENNSQPAPAARPAGDLTVWFVLALAIALVVEGLLSASATPRALAPAAQA